MTNIDPVYWLVSILWPQRMFVVYDLTILEGCTQAIWVENCFSTPCEHRVISTSILLNISV
jgi:hypothetical protein